MKIFPKNARVIFLGSSITVGGWPMYVLDEYLRSQPERRVEMYSCGVSGGNVGVMLQNLEENLRLYAPTHAVILIGINDVGRVLYTLPEGQTCFTDASQKRLNERFARINVYCAGMRTLVEKLQARGIAVTLLSPNCYDESQHPDALREVGLDAALEYMGEMVRLLAEEKGCEYWNIHALLRQLYAVSDICAEDRVHLTKPDGQMVLARLFLAGQGLAPMPDFTSEEALHAYLADCTQEKHPLLPPVAELFDMVFYLRRVLDGDFLVASQAGDVSEAERYAYVQKFRTDAKSFWLIIADAYLKDFANREKLAQEIIEKTRGIYGE